MKNFVKCAGIALVASTLASAALADQTFDNTFAGFGSSSNKQPIQIESSELQVQNKANAAIFTGDVVVTQGDAKLKANKLTVYYIGDATQAASASTSSGSEQRIKRLEADGKVYISSKDQAASGDQATFDMASQTMVMTGKQVVLTQGPNVVTGNRLTVNLATGKADLQAPKSGRVKVLLQPNSMKNK